MPTTPTEQGALEDEAHERHMSSQEHLAEVHNCRQVLIETDPSWPTGAPGTEAECSASRGYRIVKRLTGYSHPNRVAQYEYEAYARDGETLGVYGRYFQAVSATHAHLMVGDPSVFDDTVEVDPIDADEIAERIGNEAFDLAGDR